MFQLKELNLMIKKIILHRVSLTDKAFQEIHLNFIDIIYDILDPSTFVRIINDNQFVYSLPSPSFYKRVFIHFLKYIPQINIKLIWGI